MSTELKPDLQQVKTAFEKFRSGRAGNTKPRLPEQLWSQAIALLEHYPFTVVCRELRLKPNYLRQRAEAAKGAPIQPLQKKNKAKFLTLTGRELTAIKNGADKVAPSLQQASEQCRVIIERVDGSRLSLNLPVDWSRIEILCTSFLRD